MELNYRYQVALKINYNPDVSDLYSKVIAAQGSALFPHVPDSLSFLYNMRQNTSSRASFYKDHITGAEWRSLLSGGKRSAHLSYCKCLKRRCSAGDGTHCYGHYCPVSKSSHHHFLQDALLWEENNESETEVTGKTCIQVYFSSCFTASSRGLCCCCYY